MRFFCLSTLVGLCWIASMAVADDGAPPADGGNSPLQQVISLLSGQSDDPVFPVRDDSNPKAEKTGDLEGLVTETEKPEEYQKIVAESLYPPTDAPQELTLEQLEAIAKLAPKANKAGLQVHPAMVPLFRSMVLRYTGGTYKNTPIRFRLHAPESYGYQEGKKYPMVIWLHGSGECGADNINQLSHLHHIIPSLVGPKKRDFFLLVPQCPHSHVAWEAPEVCSTTVRADGSVECHVTDDPVAFGNAPVAFTLAMIDAVMKEFPVDPNRVTVAGLSTGGEGVWRILERRPELFAAAAPIVSWQAMHEKSLREKRILKKIPVWAIYSSDDRGIDFARKEFDRMRDRGCLVFKTEFGVCGHRAWTPAMLQGDVFGWLISRAKHGNRFFAAEPSPTSPEKIGIFAEVSEGDLKRVPTKASVRAERADAPDLQPLPSASTQKAREAIDVKREERGRIVVRRTGEKGAAVVAQPVRATPQPLDGPFDDQPAVAAVEQFRLDLLVRYISVGETKKAMAVADKVKNRQELVRVLLRREDGPFLHPEVLDYIDRELDRMEQRSEMPGAAARPYRAVVGDRGLVKEAPSRGSKEKPLEPIPAGKKSPKDECGKQWAMSPTTLYGLFPDGWDREAKYVPGYVLNETGAQLRDRLAKAFAEDDAAAMKEFCESFIRLDDIPLSSPWFDTSGGRLQGRIKYSLNEKAKPVVELLREIAAVQAESKIELVELAKKSLDRIDAIVSPKAKE